MIDIYIFASTICFLGILGAMFNVVRDFGFPEGGWPGLIIVIILGSYGSVLSLQALAALIQ